MPFTTIGETEVASDAFNFPALHRKRFNQWGAAGYMGRIDFTYKSKKRSIPIVSDDSLEDHPQTHQLLKNIRKTMRMSTVHSAVYIANDTAVRSIRSRHQNDNGFLPFGTATATIASSFVPAIAEAAKLYGELPTKQKKKQNESLGEFLEYTLGDDMADYGRFLIDYSFGLIYVTLGHYHPDSYMLLCRSPAELEFEIKPVLRHLGATYVA